MTVEQEEKLLKTLSIFTLLVFLPLNHYLNRYLNRYLDSDDALYYVIPYFLILFVWFIIIMVLNYRKFSRDKKAGKDLKRYKIMMFFIGITLLMALGFVFFA